MPSRTMGSIDYRACAAAPLIRGPHDLPRELIHVLLHFLVLLARRRPGESRMNSMHASVAVEEDSSRVGAEVHQLWQRLLDLARVGGARQQQRKGQSVLDAIDSDL